MKNTNKQSRPSLGTWRKAAEYCESGAVRIVSDVSDEDDRILRGKVKCNFGFVHNPAVALRSGPFGTQVVASLCDCGEANEGSSICSHCAALIFSATKESNVPVNRDPSVNLMDDDEETGADFKLKIVSDTTNESGLRKVVGRAACAFGFIHYPNVILDGTNLASYSCDCYSSAESAEPCTHCRALYAKAAASSPKKETDKKEAFERFIEETFQPEEEDPVEKFLSEQEVPSFTESVDDAPLLPEESEPETEEAEEIEETAEPEQAEETEMPEEVISEIESPEQAFEQHEAESMCILFGENERTGEQVCWYPNDTARLFHTNTGIIGTMGTGKTQFTKSLITQLYDQQAHNFTGCGLGILIFDYKGDYNESKADFVNAVNAKVLKPYKLPFNPFSMSGFKSKPRLPLHVASTFSDIVSKIYKLGPKQSAALIHCIVEAYRKCGINAGNPETWSLTPPTFDMVYKCYNDDDNIAKNDTLYAAMEKLWQFEIFESEPEKTVSLYDMLRGVTVIDLSGYDTSIQNLIVAIMLELFYSQMQNAGSSEMSGNLRRLTKFILVDEADNFMSQGFPAIKKIMKEGREFGVGVILSTQFLHHFKSKDEDYSKYILTWVVHNVADLKRSDIEFVFNTDTDSVAADKYFHDIKELQCHHSMLKIANDEQIYLRDKPFFELMSERGNRG